MVLYKEKGCLTAAFFYEQKLITQVHKRLITNKIRIIDRLSKFPYFYTKKLHVLVMTQGFRYM